MTEIYPIDENQSKLAYNFLVAFFLLLTSSLVHFIGWLPFCVAVVLSAAIIWDMYLRPWLRPDTEVDEETLIGRAFTQFMQNQDTKYKKEVERQAERIAELERVVRELKR